MKRIIVPDDRVVHIWKNSEGEICEIPPTFYEGSGTPMDGDSEDEMTYLRTEVIMPEPDDRLINLLATERYDSKDWRSGGPAERVEWLISMYESKKAELETFLAQHDRCGQLAREVIDDVEAVQMCGEEDVRETWPDLWATYELACSIRGVSPKIEPDEDYSQRV